MARLAPALALCAALFGFSGPAHSAGEDAAFFAATLGDWDGGGEIVAGKYKGTKFRCSFTGSQAGTTSKIAMDGRCRVGVFSQPMNAVIEGKNGRYTGHFLDGALGRGLDITSGNVDGDRVVFALERGELDGAMLARMVDPVTMNVTISVRVGADLVPVIGMALQKTDSMVTSSIR